MNKKKEVIVTLLVLTLLSSSFAFADESNEPKDGIAKQQESVVELTVYERDYKVNGKRKALSAQTFYDDTTVYVPLKDILEDLGGEVIWDPESHRIVARKGDKKIVIGVMRDKLTGYYVDDITINGENVLSKHEVLIICGITLVPVNWFEVLECEVRWNEKEKKITIKTTSESLQDDKLEANKPINNDNTTALNSDEKPKYEDWYFNDDFTKVNIKVDGKWETYDNYVSVERCSKSYLSFVNYGALYLTDEVVPYRYKPEEYFLDKMTLGLKEVVKNDQNEIETFFPRNESISINHKPWQESVFGDYIMNRYYICRKKYPSQNDIKGVWEFIQDPNKNGYAFETLKYGKTIDEAKRTASVEFLKVKAFRTHLCKSYDEYKEMLEESSPKAVINLTCDELEKLMSGKQKLKN